MTYDEFRASIVQPQPPSGLSALLAAMWWDAKKEWSQAHVIAQEVSSADGAWVHAYLHRKEGDENNAGYWYRQARRPHSGLLLEAEWEEIVRALLGNPLTLPQ